MAQQNPGPIDRSVLTLQAEHRSQAIWEDTDINDDDWRAFHNEGKWRARYNGHLDRRVLGYVHTAGFYGVMQIGRMKVDWHLVRAMVERWREETHTFHLPVGEATITLQDVEVLAGLRVDGAAVTDWAEPPSTSEGLANLCQELLGFLPTTIRGGRINIKEISEFLRTHPLAVDSPDVFVRQHARCLCMLMIHLILGDKSGNKVELCYLPLLRDFKECGKYSWGSAALAYLYRNLCLASRRGCKSVAGFTVLVHIWAVFRITNIRPIARIAIPDVVDPLGFVVGPAAVYYSRANLNLTEVPSHSIRLCRDHLDMMLPEHFSWQPYLGLQLPPYCSAGAGVYMYRGPLIHFNIIELHAPDRVLRQFGLRQGIPRHIDTDRGLHEVERRSTGQRWCDRFASYIALWEARRMALVRAPTFTGALPMSSEYMEWYLSITRRVIGRAALPAPARGSQPVAGLHDLSVKIFSHFILYFFFKYS